MESFTQEQRMVADAFQNGFSRFQAEPLVLYGIGTNTKAILELTNGFTIAGLLDQYVENTGKVFYGKRVLSLKEAAAISRKIVIIARTVIVPVIYERIKAFTEEKGIEVYNYAGKLLKPNQGTYDTSDLKYWNYSWEDLKADIAGHDVISFDIFDTLLGRYVLQPRDVFSLVEEELRAAGREVPFTSLRAQAEQECGYAPSLDDIYERIHQMGYPSEDCQDWCDREFRWEEKLVFPRRRVVEAYYYAKALGKRVFLVSDMYLPAEKMEALLRNCGIEDYDGLLISCQERAEKRDGTLFARLLDTVGAQSVLHIGDNRFSDGESAQRMGFDTCLLYSGYDLLMISSIQALLANIPRELGGRLALGLLCAKLFEDPFALHATKGRVVLTQPEQVGCCFFGPWALSFMQWAAERVKENNIKEFLLLSRDGFLFYNIGKIMQGYGCMPAVELKYVKASRRALALASICTEEDLRTSIRRLGPNYLTKGELLKDLFGITPAPSDTKQTEHIADLEDTVQYVIPYFSKIKADAAWKRENYEKYLRSMGLFNDCKTAAFDFVAAGTVQYYLEQQLGKQLLGLYCARSPSQNDAFFQEGCILSAFGESNSYDTRVLTRMYIAIEGLLIDGDRQLLYFDDSGNPVFESDPGVSYEYSLETQKYACAFVTDYLKRFGCQLISTHTAEQLLDALFSLGCQIDPPVSDAFICDEPRGKEFYVIPPDKTSRVFLRGCETALSLAQDVFY